jgi:hypothetical protein
MKNSGIRNCRVGDIFRDMEIMADRHARSYPHRERDQIDLKDLEAAHGELPDSHDSGT